MVAENLLTRNLPERYLRLFKEPSKYLTYLFRQKAYLIVLFLLLVFNAKQVSGQITLLQDFKNNYSAPIGTFQGINFREAGFSGLYPVAGTNGKEFWTVSDRGANIDAANANNAACRPTYDKIYSFPDYAPKIHRIRLHGDSIQILQTITIKRPNGTNATGLLNPAGFGSTAAEVVSTDTVLDCSNFNAKTAAKDIWGIDSEGILVDADGNFWKCEEGGPTVWKLSPNGVVLKRFTPYANLPGSQPLDVMIDTIFKYRKNNRGFEGISISPAGRIYAFIQSPLLYPDKGTGEGTRIHRILEINPTDNSSRMLAYLNDGIIGSGPNQIRWRDWKVGDMAAVNDSMFLVLESAARGTSDIKRIYLINISNATPVNSGYYNGSTLEALADSTGLASNGIVPVTKTLFLDLLANGWPAELDKAEGLSILNDSTILVSNDNDYGQASPTENGIASATGKLSHVIVYGLQGGNKLRGYHAPLVDSGITSITSSQSPYLLAVKPGVKYTSIITANDSVGGYKMSGTPDGLGAFDNGNGTFTLLMNHEFVPNVGVVRAHGSAGSFVSKWIINKSNLSVISGSDLVKRVRLWNPLTNTYTGDSTTAFARMCSADLPAVSAFYNSNSGKGTQERIFMNGEETGAEGRAFGHIVTGTNAGLSYELPYLGKFSWENSVARPTESDKTVVAGMDDTSPMGQVYMYVGTKTNTGSEVDKAGLNNGKLFGVSVAGLVAETSDSVPSAGTRFSLFDLGDVHNTSGAVLDATSIASGVTGFLRPEDGAWDPSNPRDFYFATTNSFTSPSRLWRLRFDDVANPETGGTIEAVLDGTEGQKMLDNITIDHYGHILMVEDVGNNVHLGKVWQYTIATDQLVQLGQHDAARFVAGGSKFLTQDEEASGVLDVQHILGPGMFLLDVQAHYSAGVPADIVEGGELLAMFNPGSAGLTPPYVRFTSPLNYSTYLSGGNVYLNARASDEDGTISKVDFYNGSALLHSTTDTPFTFKWPHVAKGYFTLTAKATDNNGLVTTSDPVHIFVVPNTPPSVKIISPSNQQIFTAPATINLEALANDVDGRIVQVSFYNGSGLLTNSEHKVPYTYQWQNVPAGIYIITAKAKDNWSAETTSVPITVIVKAPGQTSLSTVASSAQKPTGIINDQGMQLLPNPAHNVLTINTTGLQRDKPSVISVLSLAGAAIKTKEIIGSGQTIRMNIASLAKGTYIIRLTNGNTVLYQQFVKL